RHDFRNERHSNRKLPTDAQTGQKPVERKIVNGDRKSAQASARRVDENRNDHRLGTADAIAQRSEDQSAGGPPQNKNTGRIATPLGYGTIGLGNSQQVTDRRRTRDREQLLIQT